MSAPSFFKTRDRYECSEQLLKFHIWMMPGLLFCSERSQPEPDGM